MSNYLRPALLWASDWLFSFAVSKSTAALVVKIDVD